MARADYAASFSPQMVADDCRRGGGCREVVAFETAQPLGMWDRMNAALIGGRAYLPDSYGRTVEDLERLMTNWRNWAEASK